MFGIGWGEFLIIAIVLLIAVGPDKMPTFFKAIGKGLRTFRRTTRELKQSVGIDELLRDEDLRQLRNPLQAQQRPAQPTYVLRDSDRRRENPPNGVDLAHAAIHPPEPKPEPEPEAAPDLDAKRAEVSEPGAKTVPTAPPRPPTAATPPTPPTPPPAPSAPTPPKPPPVPKDAARTETETETETPNPLKAGAGK